MSFFKKNFSNIFCFFITVFIGFSSFAMEVNKTELEATPDVDKIVFRNYTGPHRVIQTRSQIAEIGTEIGTIVAENIEKSGNYKLNQKYGVIHCLDFSSKEKLDADIFILTENAGVDHIENLRLIIAGYLVSAYHYSEKDAGTLAVFITVYNAVYRADVSYFSERYKDNVLKNLEENKIGLSTNYEQWPGQSQIVIPLSDLDGGLSTIDTSIVSDKTVVASMQEDEDKGIDVRKNMIDLKEREAEDAEIQAQISQKKASEAEKYAVEKKELLEIEKKVLKDLENQLDSDEKSAKKNPRDKNAKRKLENDQKALDKQKEKVNQTELKFIAARQDADSKSKNANEKQILADKKHVESYDERKEIIKDQKEIEKEMNEYILPKNVKYGLKLTDQKEKLSGIVAIDADTGRIIKSSVIDVIRSRVFYPIGDKFLCIAGKNSGNGNVKLVLIDKENLEIIDESETILSEESVLVNSGMNYYAVIKSGKTYKIGRFDDKLNLMFQSNIDVNKATAIVISEKDIIVTDSNNTVVILNSENLELK
ncbi:MAG: P83/100 family protein [Treponemataceae bacterium]